MKKTNFDLYLDEQLKDPVFAERFEKAGEAWDVAVQLAALREKAGLSQKRACSQTQDFSAKRQPLGIAFLRGSLAQHAPPRGGNSRRNRPRCYRAAEKFQPHSCRGDRRPLSQRPANEKIDINHDQARNLVRQALTQSFAKARFRSFVLELVNQFDESKAQSVAAPDSIDGSVIVVVLIGRPTLFLKLPRTAHFRKTLKILFTLRACPESGHPNGV